MFLAGSGSCDSRRLSEVTMIYSTSEPERLPAHGLNHRRLIVSADAADALPWSATVVVTLRSALTPRRRGVRRPYVGIPGLLRPAGCRSRPVGRPRPCPDTESLPRRDSPSARARA